MNLSRTLSLLIILLFPFNANAETNNPDNTGTLELGLGLGYVTLPDYPGSKHVQNWLLPLPYINYQSPHISLTRDALAWQLNHPGPWDISLSMSGLPPTHRKHTQAVSNIDTKLDATIEIGPSLIYAITPQWQAEFAVRQVVATDLAHWQNTGWRLNPKIAYAWPQTDATDQGPQWEVTLASLWNSESYNNYFYQVEAPATPAYAASSGYGGSYFSVKYRQREKKWLWESYLKLQTLNGTSFNDSPLLETKTAVTFGVAAVWIGYQKQFSIPEHWGDLVRQ